MNHEEEPAAAGEGGEGEKPEGAAAEGGDAAAEQQPDAHDGGE